MPMKIALRFRLLLPCLFLNLVLFLGIFFRLFPVRLAARTTQAHLCVQDCGLDPFRLIKPPLIGRLDLSHHCFVGMTSGKQSGDCRQHRENRRTQGHPRNPFLAAVLGMVMNFFVQMFQWHFGFFHCT